METYPPVTITEIAGTIASLQKGKGVDLGDETTNSNVNKILSAMRHHANKVFHLQWEGNKIPRGALIEGAEIAWTQNGMVSGSKGENIGTYERLVEFGGASGKEQQMLVFVI